ncbi:hypothetical protein HanXRQr2_Chr03g0134611 [Helianthus annuus]|uniref:Late embryogenesis abundant protein, LEA-14 n=2 Tax=Helianthus annuus TaxID=4232 RepID=A0A251VBL5_HELAN|nr:hypothetical protein HanXRQr2_Chr03g0134611 [Helianthus annuus]KAJ0594710.1 putative protein NDR1 [Helianthus annuus]KAJ0609769.1 putative protein NDR1 [Helianthus annuus]KAJ0775544.1 putative protein NDR1 [Helianthus annuus]KAJ0818915.1 putative protein NDR1 [Helianthus annuus]
MLHASSVKVYQILRKARSLMCIFSFIHHYLSIVYMMNYTLFPQSLLTSRTRSLSSAVRSSITTMTTNDDKGRSTKDPRRDEKGCSAKEGCACFCVLIFIFIIIIVFIYMLILLPVPSPTFTLNDVKLYTFNLSTTLTSNFQITISSKNQDYDTAFHFDRLNVSASYRSQQITLPTMIPMSYLHAPYVTIWSPYLNGTEVPLSPELVVALAQDQTAGTMLINVEVTGRLSWKFCFYSFHCGLKVNCPAYVMFGNNNDSNYVVGSAVKHPFSHEECDIEVGEVKF